MNEVITEKACVHCGQVKPVGEFYRKTATPDGYQPWCKSCVAEYKIEYNKTHKKSKVCSGCNRRLPISHFDINRQKIDGHFSRCKDCKREYNRQYRARKEMEITPEITNEMVVMDVTITYSYGNCKLVKSDGSGFELFIGDEKVTIEDYRSLEYLIKKYQAQTKA